MFSALGLNYLGLSILTAGVVWLAWQVVKIALIIAFYGIMLAFMLVKWLWGLIVKLFQFIF